MSVRPLVKTANNAVLGGYGGKMAVGGWNFIFLSVYYHNKRLHVKFGCSRAIFVNLTIGKK